MITPKNPQLFDAWPGAVRASTGLHDHSCVHVSHSDWHSSTTAHNCDINGTGHNFQCHWQVLCMSQSHPYAGLILEHQVLFLEGAVGELLYGPHLFWPFYRLERPLQGRSQCWPVHPLSPLESFWRLVHGSQVLLEHASVRSIPMPIQEGISRKGWRSIQRVIMWGLWSSLKSLVHGCLYLNLPVVLWPRMAPTAALKWIGIAWEWNTMSRCGYASGCCDWAVWGCAMIYL